MSNYFVTRFFTFFFYSILLLRENTTSTVLTVFYFNFQYAIGLDCEFLSGPSLVKESACLLQLASTNKTYLLDMPALLNVLSDEDMDKFVSTLFIEGAHVILGYGMNNDMQVLANTHPRFQRIVER